MEKSGPRKSRDVMLAYSAAYWAVLIVTIVFLVIGGQLNVESWLVTFHPPVSFPFTWLIVPLIIL